MSSCAVYGCNVYHTSKVEGVTFHRFPANEELRRKWAAAIGREDWTPSDNSRICSRHFLEEMFDRSMMRVRLRKNAIPELNLNMETSGMHKKSSSRLRALQEEKFMENFDPERSARETRKMHRKFSAASRVNSVYDEKGVHMGSGEDLCDCLDPECEGCFYPCPKCKSLKCGLECRVLRKWTYSSIDIDGSDVTVRNPLLND